MYNITDRTPCLISCFVQSKGDDGPSTIKAPTILEDDQDEDEVDDDELDSRCWFLSHSPARSSLLWVHTTGSRASCNHNTAFQGSTVHTYPRLRCFVYHRETTGSRHHEHGWERKTGFGGRSLFLGTNQPIWFVPPEPPAGQEARPTILAGDYVYTTHARNIPLPGHRPDWCRLSLLDDATIGADLEYDDRLWGRQQTPVWMVPNRWW